MSENIGVRGSGCAFPAASVAIDEVFAAEGVTLDAAVQTRLGIEKISTRGEETGAELAVSAGRTALEAAGIEAEALGVILDCTTSPQDYLAPAWNMSNRVQHELGAKNAFTVGFSGAGASALLVALDFASSILKTDDAVGPALIVASETPIAAHRVLHPENAVTVLGDGAGALVLDRADDGAQLLSTRLSTNGSRHDASYIPGGAMKHPLREDLYRPQLDRSAYEEAAQGAGAHGLAAAICSTHGADLATATLVAPNYSESDDALFADGVGAKAAATSAAHRRERGHLHAVDLILNLEAAIEAAAAGDHLLIASHGNGYTTGAALVRC